MFVAARKPPSVLDLCLLRLPAKSRRPVVGEAFVMLDRLSTDRARWMWKLAAAVGSGLLVSAISGGLGSLAMPVLVNTSAVTFINASTVLPVINGTGDVSGAQIQIGHWVLLGTSQVLAHGNALMTHAEAFVHVKWTPRRLKRLGSAALTVVEAFLFNTLMCAAHCSSDPGMMNPFLLPAWACHSLLHVFLRSTAGVQTAVIAELSPAEKKALGLGQRLSPERGSITLVKRNWWMSVLLCALPEYWGSLPLPRQLVHAASDERVRQQWLLLKQDRWGLGVAVVALGGFGYGMHVICDANTGVPMVNHHLLGWLAAIAFLVPLLRRSLELTRHFSIATTISWGALATVSFCGVMASCMTEGYGFAACLVAAVAWSRCTALPASVRMRPDGLAQTPSAAMELRLLGGNNRGEEERFARLGEDWPDDQGDDFADNGDRPAYQPPKLASE